MGVMNHPVGYTCPDIDTVIDVIKEASKGIYKIVDDLKPVVKDGLVEQLEVHADDLEGLISWRSNKLETLREANDTLRKWGVELNEELDEARNEINRLEEKVSDLEQELRYAINN